MANFIGIDVGFNLKKEGLTEAAKKAIEETKKKIGAMEVPLKAKVVKQSISGGLAPSAGGYTEADIQRAIALAEARGRKEGYKAGNLNSPEAQAIYQKGVSDYFEYAKKEVAGQKFNIGGREVVYNPDERKREIPVIGGDNSKGKGKGKDWGEDWVSGGGISPVPTPPPTPTPPAKSPVTPSTPAPAPTPVPTPPGDVTTDTAKSMSDIVKDMHKVNYQVQNTTELIDQLQSVGSMSVDEAKKLSDVISDGGFTPKNVEAKWRQKSIPDPNATEADENGQIPYILDKEKLVGLSMKGVNEKGLIVTKSVALNEKSGLYEPTRKEGFGVREDEVAKRAAEEAQKHINEAEIQGRKLTTLRSKALKRNNPLVDSFADEFTTEYDRVRKEVLEDFREQTKDENGNIKVDSNKLKEEISNLENLYFEKKAVQKAATKLRTKNASEVLEDEETKNVTAKKKSDSLINKLTKTGSEETLEAVNNINTAYKEVSDTFDALNKKREKGEAIEKTDIEGLTRKQLHYDEAVKQGNVVLGDYRREQSEVNKETKKIADVQKQFDKINDTIDKRRSENNKVKAELNKLDTSESSKALTDLKNASKSENDFLSKLNRQQEKGKQVTSDDLAKYAERQKATNKARESGIEILSRYNKAQSEQAKSDTREYNLNKQVEAAQKIKNSLSEAGLQEEADKIGEAINTVHDSFGKIINKGDVNTFTNDMRALVDSTKAGEEALKGLSDAQKQTDTQTSFAERKAKSLTTFAKTESDVTKTIEKLRTLGDNAGASKLQSSLSQTKQALFDAFDATGLENYNDQLLQLRNNVNASKDIIKAAADAQKQATKEASDAAKISKQNEAQTREAQKQTLADQKLARQTRGQQSKFTSIEKDWTDKRQQMLDLGMDSAVTGLDKQFERIKAAMKNIGTSAGAAEITNQFTLWSSSLGRASKDMQKLVEANKQMRAQNKTTADVEGKIGTLDKVLSHPMMNAGFTANSASLDALRSRLAAVREAYANLYAQLSSGKLDTTQYQEVSDALNNLEKEYDDVIKKSKIFDGSVKSNRQLQNVEVNAQKSISQIQKMRTEWTKMAKDPNAMFRLNNIEKMFSSAVRPEDITAARTELAAFRTDMQATNKAGMSFTDSLKSKFSKFSQWFGVSQIIMGLTRGLKQVVQSVADVNKEMTEYRKVTDLTEQGYDKFLKGAGERAKAIGSTLTGYVQASANIARMGYSDKETTQISEDSQILYNVGDDFQSVDDATQTIISTLKAFKLEAIDSTDVMDKLNEVSNRYAVTTSGLATSLRSSASALADAGNDLDQSLAMMTAMTEITQDDSVTGSTLKVLALRLRGAKTEIEDAGESTDGMAESTSKLRGKILALTNVEGKGGFDILTKSGQFKSTYEMIQGIANVWDKMTNNVDRSALLELIAGKNRSSSVAALISNWSTAEKALQTSMGSSGSATEELDKWLTQVEAKKNKLTASFQSFSTSFLDSKFLGMAYDAGSGILDILTGITDALGSLPSLVAAVAASFSLLTKSGILNRYAPSRERLLAA